jgi:hypothetical protein
MQRRKWSSKDKMTIVLEGLKGTVPLGELCAKFQISQSQYYKWRDQLLANGPKVFDYGGIDRAIRGHILIPLDREAASHGMNFPKNSLP